MRRMFLVQRSTVPFSSSFFHTNFLATFLLLLLFQICPAAAPNVTNKNEQNATNEKVPTNGEKVFKLPNDDRPNPDDILLKEKDDQLSTDTLQALLSIGLYFNGTDRAGEAKKKKLKLPELSCNAQEKSLCANARMCIHRENVSDFECICRKGYAGRFCQFSLFPRSCADALAFHEDGADEGGTIALMESGVWQLDLDGSAPLPATYAECLVDGGITRVSHNAPQEGFIVRSAELFARHNQSLFFPISYKLFSPAHLRALIARSESCWQTIRFDCAKSPLDFKGNQTWLEIASMEGQQFRQIGSKPFSCACRNKELYGCGRDELTCYCDDLTQANAMDQAILGNKSAGVTAVFLRRPNVPAALMGSQRLNLGPLECSGEAGTAQNALVTFRSLSARLETGAFHGWRQLELDFRTWQPDIEQIVTGWAPTGMGEMQLKISLRAGHRIELTLSHQNAEDGDGHSEEKEDDEDEEEEEEVTEAGGKYTRKRAPATQQKRRRQPETIRREVTLSIASLRPLNDLFWHRLLVEWFRAEVRFSIDRLNAFQPLTFPFPSATRFAVGGDEKGAGFVGCIGNFRVDQRLVDWRSQLELLREGKEGGGLLVAAGCRDMCQESQCEQGAKCVEHFDTETTECECRQPRIHFGENCEKNVNQNSSILFTGGSFLRFAGLPFSALTAESVVFSARTDQRRALLLYEHDHLDNFIQIHLADEYRIVLTLNNRSRLLNCTVESKPGKVFNNMNWLQFVIEREPSGGDHGHGPLVTMHVDEEQCQIGDEKGGGGGVIMLNSKEEFNREETDQVVPMESAEMEDAILPPVPVSSRQQPSQPFHFLFIGGLPRATRRTKRQRERRAEKRLPVYVSGMPSLRGCLRGLLIDGEKLDLREAVENGTNIYGRVDGIRIGCELDCEEHQIGGHCQNGGNCKVDWRLPQNAQPPIHCDCAMTSYVGPNCTEDIGLTFSGHSSVLFDLAHPKRFSFLGDSDRQRMAFAFSAAQTGDHQHQKQQLVTVYFEGGRELHAKLDNGTLAVGLFVDRGNPSATLLAAHRFDGANFTDGHRHSFLSHFSGRKPPLISLDGIRHQFGGGDLVGSGGGWSLANAKMFYFGGKKDMEEGEEGNEEEGDGETKEKEEEYSSESRESKGGKKPQEEEDAPAPSPMPTESATKDGGGGAKEESGNQNGGGGASAAESILMADAMREIMARQVEATADGEGGGEEEEMMRKEEEDDDEERRKNEDVRKKEDDGGNRMEAKREKEETKWPKQRGMVHHFSGTISNLVIEYERTMADAPPDSSILRFTPFLYYLQEDEFLHASVRNDPLDGAKLPMGTSGQFHLSEPTPPPSRDVQFPVWEAPFHPVPFLDWDPSEEAVKNARHKNDDNFAATKDQTNVFFWFILPLLILLLLIFIICCCCCCFCRKEMEKGRKQSGQFSGDSENKETEKRPILSKATKSNGNGRQSRREKEEVDQNPANQIQLLLQRPLKSPPPPAASPIGIPQIEEFPEPATVKRPKSILRTPGQRKTTNRPAMIELPEQLNLVENGGAMPETKQVATPHSETGTSSGASYFTARDYFPADDLLLLSASSTSSFVSMEQPDPPTNFGSEEDDSMIGQDFEERAPELMDESTLELSNGGDGIFAPSSSSTSSSRCQSASIQLSPSSPSSPQPNLPNRPFSSGATDVAAIGTPETLTYSSRGADEEEDGQEEDKNKKDAVTEEERDEQQQQLGQPMAHSGK